jgi:hypothetical protein
MRPAQNVSLSLFSVCSVIGVLDVVDQIVDSFKSAAELVDNREGHIADKGDIVHSVDQLMDRESKEKGRG